MGDHQIQAANGKEWKRNRDILSSLIAITLYLARQGLPFRGNETFSSQNRGHFLELVEVFSKYDCVLKLHFDSIKEQQKAGKRPLVSLLFNRSQNIIKALATSVRRVIHINPREWNIFHFDRWNHRCVTHWTGFICNQVHTQHGNQRMLPSGVKCAVNNWRGSWKGSNGPSGRNWPEDWYQGSRLWWGCKHEWMLSGNSVNNPKKKSKGLVCTLSGTLS